MTKKLEKFKSKYNGAIQVVEKRKHSAKKIDEALQSLSIPKGVTLKQIKSCVR